MLNYKKLNRADGGGTLDKEEVGELVADLGLTLNEIELDEAFQEL